ncbi:MAG: type II toxin-antitoxin system RelE/ParE family toxin [Pseudomonadota bacterium]|nr:type II toxin-antitoxin system RelE/ParE family toxin [Pseudomonadota bacterium]
MAEIVWSESAISDLDAIADYIAVENQAAAAALIQRVVGHVDQLIEFPESGSKPHELGRNSRYRQIVEPPCRVFYRFDGSQVFILYIMRAERPLRPREITKRTVRAKA